MGILGKLLSSVSLVSIWCLLIVEPGKVQREQDHLGTLKTYQRAACDEESMTLKCPLGTTISVVLAQYGRAGVNSTDRCSYSDPSTYIGDRQANQTCIWPQSLQ
ncbi:uncharacterized protein LOC108630968, partial [Ceratina calcarata]|uniref:Uncharacterized protein LOC108630968 n=1 Tax=Ceratina calcarata TaxID=156304 RepID=A0AAJ7SA45_9HYME